MTALSTPTFEPHPFPNQPYPTQVYYDWANQHQLTRFFLPDGSLEDAILTNSITYMVARFPDGTHKCLGTVPVGLPYPNWPTHEGTCTCKGVITNNPQLSPDKTTQIFTKDSMPPRHFWFWYSTANEAIMFAEVPQACNVELILTDYFDFMPNPPAFDPSLFVVPPDCLSQPAAMLPTQGKKVTSTKSPRKASQKKKVAAKKRAIHKPVKKSTTRKPARKVKSKSTRKSVARKVTKKIVTRKPMRKVSSSKSTRKAKSTRRK
jgi:hypothetical protein